MQPKQLETRSYQNKDIHILPPTHAHKIPNFPYHHPLPLIEKVIEGKGEV